MKRYKLYLLTLLLSLMALSSMNGQNANKPHVLEVFDRYGRAKDVTMVVMNRDMLAEYDILLYKSLTMHKPGNKRLRKIQTAVSTDRKLAKSIKEVIDNGILTSGYYELPPTNRMNRYILYRYSTKKGVTLIYIEGEIDSEDLVSLLLQSKNN